MKQIKVEQDKNMVKIAVGPNQVYGFNDIGQVFVWDIDSIIEKFILNEATKDLTFNAG